MIPQFDLGTVQEHKHDYDPLGWPWTQAWHSAFTTLLPPLRTGPHSGMSHWGVGAAQLRLCFSKGQESNTDHLTTPTANVRCSAKTEGPRGSGSLQYPTALCSIFQTIWQKNDKESAHHSGKNRMALAIVYKCWGKNVLMLLPLSYLTYIGRVGIWHTQVNPSWNVSFNTVGVEFT